MPNDEALWESAPNIVESLEWDRFEPDEEDMDWFLEAYYVDPYELLDERDYL